MLDLPQELRRSPWTTFEAEEGIVETVAYYAFKQGIEYRVARSCRRCALFLFISCSVNAGADRRQQQGRLQGCLGRSSCSVFYRHAGIMSHRKPTASARCASALTGDPRHASTEAHFFDNLGANSLLMARVCASLRFQGMSNVSMRDIYMHPTIG